MSRITVPRRGPRDGVEHDQEGRHRPTGHQTYKRGGWDGLPILGGFSYASFLRYARGCSTAGLPLVGGALTVVRTSRAIRSSTKNPSDPN